VNLGYTNSIDIGILVCPETKSTLRIQEDQLISSEGRIYQIRPDGKLDFLGISFEKFKRQRDFLDRLKAIAKRIAGNKYQLLIGLFAPVMPRIHWKSFQTYWSYLVARYSKEKKIVLQIGSGNDRVNNRVINIDIFDFTEVDIIADCTRLPFPDNSVDVVISKAVLEHVEQPADFLKEAQRVLVKDGIIITGVPFIQGFHASPHDYYRWTNKGLESFHMQHGFQKVEVVNGSGPASGFLWVFQEFMSILLSFNINTLYYFWYFVFLIVLIPFKLFDIVLVNFTQASKIESFFYYVGRKAE
jgi:predicted SAM-dependent methyltransferase